MQIRKIERNRLIVDLRKRSVPLSFSKIARELNMRVSQVYKIYVRDRELYKSE